MTEATTELRTPDGTALDGAAFDGRGAPDPRRWATLAVLCVSLLVIVIDNTIVNVALPTLVRDLGSSISDLQWVVDAYSLVFAGLLLTAGTLGDRYGRKGALTAGLVVFGVASGAAAFATDVTSLIGARAVMGIGAATIIAPRTGACAARPGAACTRARTAGTAWRGTRTR